MRRVLLKVNLIFVFDAWLIIHYNDYAFCNKPLSFASRTKLIYVLCSSYSNKIILNFFATWSLVKACYSSFLHVLILISWTSIRLSWVLYIGLSKNLLLLLVLFFKYLFFIQMIIALFFNILEIHLLVLEFQFQFFWLHEYICIFLVSYHLNF